MSQRRDFLKSILAGGLAGAALTGNGKARNFNHPTPKKPKGATRILHLTDMHLRPEYQCPERSVKLVKAAIAEAGHIDLVFNGGDTIYAADYKNITRDRVLEQWKIWDDHVAPLLKPYPVIHALGNHDMWWAVAKDDEMYGKPYVLQRLKQKQPYFAIDSGAWRLLVLDCNNSGLLDPKQEKWLMKEAKDHPQKPLLIMSHQPILMAEWLLGRGMNKREHQLIDPFISTDIEARPVHFVSGHYHLLDHLQFKNVEFHCNGALSGFWWETNAKASKDCSYEGTPMGYSIIDLYADGTLINNYRNCTDVKDHQVIKT